MVEADLVRIYHKLCNYYPLMLINSLAAGYKTTVDFPVLKGASPLGNFEMFFWRPAFFRVLCYAWQRRGVCPCAFLLGN